MTVFVQTLLMALLLGQAEGDGTTLPELQSRAEATTIMLLRDETAKAKLVTMPIFRYSDQIRGIKNAGIWLWTADGRPVSAMKIENYVPGVHVRPWLYCFTSLSGELVDVTWDVAPRFRAQKPGVVWQPLTDKPAESRPARLVQMREFARRFSAELRRQVDESDKNQMRLLPRPLYRYDGGADAVDGAIFGFSGTGTNPDLMLLLDLSRTDGWRYAFAGMSAEAISVQLNDATVWQQPHTAGKGNVFASWTYFVPNE